MIAKVSELRMAKGWQPLPLETKDQIVVVQATGEVLNLSAILRNHLPDCTGDPTVRLLVLAESICCQDGHHIRTLKPQSRRKL